MTRKAKPRPLEGNSLPLLKQETTIAIVEQNSTYWELLSQYLQKVPNFTISPDEHTYDSLLASMTSYDVIIFDFQRESLTQGKAFVTQIQKMHPRTKSIIFSAMEAAYPIATLIRAGAFNFVSKNQGLEALVKTIQDASLGRRPKRLPLNDFAYLLGGNEVFTPRETEIITVMARSGLNNEELADHFSIDPKTIKAHLSRSMSKTHTASRAQLILLALTFGLVPLDKIELPFSINGYALDSVIDE